MKLTLTLFTIALPMLLLAQETTTIRPETASEKKAQSELLQGDLKLGSKKYSEAIDHYTRAVELNSELICAYVYRADAYFNLGKNAEACADVQKANKLGCNRPEMPALLKKCNDGGGK